jgi:pyruvate dehydrogenase E2 component (dihydrolipoamide acetyltransferase)
VAHDIQRAARKEAPEKARAERPAEEGAPATEARRPLPDEELPTLELAEDEAEIEKASFRQRTQARRVTAAKHAIPHFYITSCAEVTSLLEAKEELKAEHGATLTHLVMLACIKALSAHPEVNRSYDRGNIIKWKGIHLGLAIDTPEGLTVAVLRNAQALPLPELVERSKALVERARDGKLSAEERAHPTFVVSNLGMYDVEHFEAIINPPAAITLAIASALDAPVVLNGEIVPGKLMRLTISCDHRILDGVTAAKFLKDLKALLEDTERLLKRA